MLAKNHDEDDTRAGRSVPEHSPERATAPTNGAVRRSLVPSPEHQHALEQIAQHNLMAALENYYAVVMCGGCEFKPWNLLSDGQRSFYEWAVATARFAIWRR